VIRYSKLPEKKPDYSATTPDQQTKAELDAVRARCDWRNLSKADRSALEDLESRLPGYSYARAAKQKQKERLARAQARKAEGRSKSLG
jgi:hypothetical protein